MSTNSKLRVLCAYQGGKQRIAKQIVDILISQASGKDAHYYDLCCGSGAISIELVNRGIAASKITMLDKSSWGVFWQAIGSGAFDMNVFDELLSGIPTNKRLVKAYMTALSAEPIHNEAELYPILQACSFGGKQIWANGAHWENAFIRDYWEPTPTSVRRSPANPMQPSPAELKRRITVLANHMQGVNCIHDDIETILNSHIPANAIVYMDPPYRGTTGYAFGFDVNNFITRFRQTHRAPLLVSESMALSDDSAQLVFGGAKGGISGVRVGKHQEWLSRF